MSVNERLEYLRGEIEGERISMGELVELQNLGTDGLIPNDDVVLLEWAGVPEGGSQEKIATVVLTIAFSFDQDLDEEQIKETALEWIGSVRDHTLAEGMSVTVENA